MWIAQETQRSKRLGSKRLASVDCSNVKVAVALPSVRRASRSGSRDHRGPGQGGAERSSKRGWNSLTLASMVWMVVVVLRYGVRTEGRKLSYPARRECKRFFCNGVHKRSKIQEMQSRKIAP